MKATVIRPGLICFSLVALLLAFADLRAELPKSSGEKNSNPKELGAIAIMVKVYTATRTTVRYMYEEILYWEGLYDTYNNMKGWWEHNKETVQDLGEKVVALSQNAEISMDCLRDLNQVFNTVDHLVIDETENFDNLMSSAEYYLDGITRRDFTYVNRYGVTTGTIQGLPTGLIPNSDKIADWILGFQRTPSTKAAVVQRLGNGATEEDIPTFEEDKMRAASTVIAASSMAKGRMYRNWATAANASLPDREREIKAAAKNVNEKQMAAAWYNLETYNAQEKALRSEMEEVKVLTQILGNIVMEASGIEAERKVVTENVIKHVGQ